MRRWRPGSRRIIRGCVTKEEISKRVRRAINLSFAEISGKGLGRTEWTQAITKALLEEGKRAKFKTTGHGNEDKSWGEWLYDVCWLKHKDSQYDFLQEAALIVEYEFGNAGDIRDDFHKLLVGRARVRCMIWDDPQTRQTDIISCRLAEMVKAFSATFNDDFYLLASYTDKGFDFWHLCENAPWIQKITDEP